MNKGFKELYKMGIEMSIKDENFIDLLEHAKTEEEKEFYVMIKNFFMKKGMYKIIKGNLFY